MRYQLALPFSDNDLYGDWWEYLFLASPERSLTERVMAVKEDFSETYGYRMAIETWPHVTLASFKAKGKIEPHIVQLIKHACRRHREFAVNLQGFDGFQNPINSVIYINVKEHQPFLQIADSLRALNDCLHGHGCPNASLVDYPHLTIARGLPYIIYADAIEEYRKKIFTDLFLVNKLVLLKRRHQKTKGQRITTLYLSSN